MKSIHQEAREWKQAAVELNNLLVEISDALGNTKGQWTRDGILNRIEELKKQKPAKRPEPPKTFPIRTAYDVMDDPRRDWFDINDIRD